MGSDNQYTFEVVRDIATILLSMKQGDTVTIRAHCHGTMFYWHSTRGEPCGPGEASKAMREAYQSVFDRRNPDRLEQLLKTLEDSKVCDENLESTLLEIKTYVRDYWRNLKAGHETPLPSDDSTD